MFSRAALPGALTVAALTCLLAVSFAADGWLGTQRDTYMAGKATRLSFIAQAVNSVNTRYNAVARSYTFYNSSSFPWNAYMHAIEQEGQSDTFFVDGMVLYYPDQGALLRFTSNPDRYPYGLIKTSRGTVGNTYFTGYIPVSGNVSVYFTNFTMSALFQDPYLTMPDWYSVKVTGGGTVLYMSGSSEIKAKTETSIGVSGEQYDDFHAKVKMYIDEARLVQSREAFSNASTPEPLGFYSLSWQDSVPVRAQAVVTNAEFQEFNTVYSSP